MGRSEERRSKVIWFGWREFMVEILRRGLLKMTDRFFVNQEEW